MSKAPRSATAYRDWGTDESGTSICHVDMDAFFAACELVSRPELRGKPVIIGGGERSVVLAATYEARAFGVKSAMPMAIARRQCPHAVVLPPDFSKYGPISDSVMAKLRAITPLVEQVSVDEAFFDVSGARRRLGPPTAIARRLRMEVEAEHGVTCSVGIAKNKFLAKLASTHAKPNGMLLVPAEASVPFLRTLPVGALWGVGEATERALSRWGITTVAELADTDLLTLQTAVGKVSGAHLHDLAWGRDPRPVVPSRHEKSISNETTFGTFISERTEVETHLLYLCDKVAARLREQRVVASTVAVKVRTSDFHTVTRARKLQQPTDVAATVYETARALFYSVDLRGLPVRLIGVKAETLHERAHLAEQLTLEESTSSRSGARREAELALDAVRKRFGRRAIGIGPGVIARRGLS